MTGRTTSRALERPPAAPYTAPYTAPDAGQARPAGVEAWRAQLCVSIRHAVRTALREQGHDVRTQHAVAAAVLARLTEAAPETPGVTPPVEHVCNVLADLVRERDQARDAAHQARGAGSRGHSQ